MKQTAVLCLSGGIDSAVLLYHLLESDFTVRALTVDYGQRNAQELKYAKALCEKVEVKQHLIELSSFGTMIRTTSGPRLALMSKSETIPTGEYTKVTRDAFYVPNRNAILLSLAWGLACSIGASVVAYGAHAANRASYPDNSPEFVSSLSEALYLGNRGLQNPELKLYTPFLKSTKVEIITVGSYLKVPFDYTWSCYDGQRYPCGNCAACIEREDSFGALGIDVRYAEVP